MRVEDAPKPGWYPDPQGGSRLRWWEGTDWADRWRAPPTRSEVDRRALVAATHAADDHHVDIDQYRDRLTQGGSISRQDSQAIVDQVRMAARAEAERAAEMFGAQARSATQNLQPLITEYTSKLTRWLRRAAVVAIVLLVAYVAFQLFAQASLFEWIGDRIDNLTDENGAGPGPWVAAALPRA